MTTRPKAGHPGGDWAEDIRDLTARRALPIPHESRDVVAIRIATIALDVDAQRWLFNR